MASIHLVRVPGDEVDFLRVEADFPQVEAAAVHECEAAAAVGVLGEPIKLKQEI